MRYINIRFLTEKEQAILKEISEAEFEKLKGHFKDIDIEMQIKKMDKGGKPYYYINLRLDSPSFLTKSEAEDWDFKKVIHMAFEKIERELKHKFRHG